MLVIATIGRTFVGSLADDTAAAPGPRRNLSAGGGPTVGPPRLICNTFRLVFADLASLLLALTFHLQTVEVLREGARVRLPCVFCRFLDNVVLVIFFQFDGSGSVCNLRHAPTTLLAVPDGHYAECKAYGHSESSKASHGKRVI